MNMPLANAFATSCLALPPSCSGSAANAITGISLVGSLVAAGSDHGRLSNILGFIAVICATVNVVGGFLITDRMLKMFRRDTRKQS